MRTLCLNKVLIVIIITIITRLVVQHSLHKNPCWIHHCKIAFSHAMKHTPNKQTSCKLKLRGIHCCHCNYNPFSLFYLLAGYIHILPAMLYTCISNNYIESWIYKMFVFDHNSEYVLSCTYSRNWPLIKDFAFAYFVETFEWWRVSWSV